MVTFRSGENFSAKFYTLILLMGLAIYPSPCYADDDIEVQVHSAGILSWDLGDLETALPPRGSVTQQLAPGFIDSTGEFCWVVISDATSGDFCEEFGAIRAQMLKKVPDSATNQAYFEDGLWHFPEDAGRVARYSADGSQVLPPQGNLAYSPLKRFEWDGKLVTANMPMVVWGSGPGQSLLIDSGGCDPLIRSNPPSPFFVGNGPGGNCAGEASLDRYKGGQALDIDLDAMTVTMKLHLGTFAPNKIPYYTVFDASKGPPAGMMGVPHVPLMSELGRYQDDLGTGLVVQFGNGVPQLDGGPNRFQSGLASYPGGKSKKYSPMWVIWWAYFTNGTPADEMFLLGRNVGEGATPVPGSQIAGFDPAHPSNFDPFQIMHKGHDLTDFAIEVTENDLGMVEKMNDLFDLVDSGHMILTEAPGGLRLNSPMQSSLIVNCPVPITLKK